MALKQVRTATGVELTAQSGSGFVVNSGGYITVKAGANLDMQGTLTISNTLTVTGNFVLDDDSQTTIGGSSGHQATVDIGPYTTWTWTGPTTSCAFGQNTTVSFAGASGNPAALSIGNYTNVTMNGANSTLVLTNGAYTMAGGTWAQSGGTVNHSGGTFNINGATFNQSSDNNRTGADLPSGTSAYRGLRFGTTPAANGNLNVSYTDVTTVFVNNASDIELTLTGTSTNCVHYIIQDAVVNLTNKIDIKLGGTIVGTFPAGAGAYRTLMVICADGLVSFVKQGI